MKCCIKQCGARKNRIHPNLTLHRFPANKELRNKWLESVGIDNINHGLQYWFVCSLHFNEASFNRTLNVIRLRDGVVPSLLIPEKTNISSLPTTQSTCHEEEEWLDDSENEDILIVKSGQPDSTSHILISDTPNISNLPTRKICTMELESSDDSKNNDPHFEKSGQPDSTSHILISDTTNISNLPTRKICTMESSNNSKNNDSQFEKNQLYKKIHFLKERCNFLTNKVKCLNAKLRRRNKKIARFSTIFKILRKKKFESKEKKEESIIFIELEEPENSLKPNC